MRSIRKRGINWFMPVLFIGYYCCVSFYSHIHIEGGEVITHSHPFSRQANSIPHQHNSVKEIVLFHSLSSIFITDGIVQAIDLDKLYPLYLATYISREHSAPLYPIYGELSPRAPPFA